MTPAKQKGGRIFYGWWVVLAAGVGLFLNIGAVLVAPFGVFFKPLSEEFGWSRAEVSLAISLVAWAGSGAVLLVGRLVDRLGARTVIIPSVVLLGLGVISFAFLSSFLWHFYALYLLLGMVGSGTSPVPYSKVIAQWFDKQRGLTLALAVAGNSLGFLVMPALAQTLVTAVGWRHAYLLLGLLVIGGTLLVVGPLLKETPQALGLVPDGEPEAAAKATDHYDQEQGLSGREAWRTSAFWLLVSAFFLVSISFHACFIHLVPLLTDRGLSAQSAALALSAAGGGALLGRVGCGYLLDRFFAPYVGTGFFCGAALGIFLLWSGMVGNLAFVAAVLLGLGQGAELDLMAYMVSRYFGLRAFGEIYSYAFAAYALGAGIGPLLMGMGFDSTGSYQGVLGGFIVASLVAAGCMIQLGPYRVRELAAEPA